MQNRLSQLLAGSSLLAASLLPLQSAHAWTPWGLSMFGIDFGQSTGTSPYYGSNPWGGNSSGPWGWNMFGMTFGQSTGYGRSYYPGW